MNKIKIGIVGYGNLGKGLISAINNTDDMELVKIFTRRNPKDFNIKEIESLDNILEYKDIIHVLVLSLGSAIDIPIFAPKLAKDFNTVDCYDNHSNMLNYYKIMDKIARENNNTSMIAMGWDPGLFSLNRFMAESILPKGKSFTFWGPGLSQGHSDALRRIEGIKLAVQYTIPKKEILNNISNQPDNLETCDTHDRQCFVVLEKNYNRNDITEEIIHMKDYFEDYNTEVNFISEEEFKQNHQSMPHGGHIIRIGETGKDHKENIKFSLKLASNPEFTASVALAGARAVYKMNQLRNYGSITILDTPAQFYSPLSLEELIDEYL